MKNELPPRVGKHASKTPQHNRPGGKNKASTVKRPHGSGPGKSSSSDEKPKTSWGVLAFVVASVVVGVASSKTARRGIAHYLGSDPVVDSGRDARSAALEKPVDLDPTPKKVRLESYTVMMPGYSRDATMNAEGQSVSAKQSLTETATFEFALLAKSNNALSAVGLADRTTRKFAESMREDLLRQSPTQPGLEKTLLESQILIQRLGDYWSIRYPTITDEQGRSTLGWPFIWEDDSERTMTQLVFTNEQTVLLKYSASPHEYDETEADAFFSSLQMP